MEAPNSRMKLREAKFFLGHISSATATVIQEPEHVQFYMNAFVSAARNVTFVMQNERRQAFYEQLFGPKERRDFGLDPQDDKLFHHFHEQRTAVVHHEGQVKDMSNIPDKIPVYGEYRDASGQYIVSGPFWLMDGPPLTRWKSRYYFAIDGENRDAIDCCRRYVEILEGLVALFESESDGVETEQ